MSSELLHRYNYGNSNVFLPFTPENDFFYGIPDRQRKLIDLTKKQLELQESTAGRIASSNIAAADTISRELREQAAYLGNAISSIGSNIQGTIEDVGDRICAELSEVQWELAQQRAITEQILAVLKRPRSTEAQELIRQGVRNLINGKIKEAEVRFRKALDLDNTDYQVLMNLSYIALHKADTQEAIDFINDALTLPEELDPQARADALWSMGRIYYAMEQYNRALSYAQESLRSTEIPKRVFQTGVYAILAGNKQLGLELIEKAVRSDSYLFALGAVEPDLDRVRTEILALLSRVAQDVARQCADLYTEVKSEISAIKSKGQSKMYSDLTEQVVGPFKKIEPMLRHPSYTETVRCLYNLDILQTVANSFSELDSRYHQRGELERQEKRARGSADRISQGVSADLTLPPALVLVVTYIGMGAIYWASQPPEVYNDALVQKTGSLTLVIWPLQAVVMVLGALFGQPRISMDWLWWGLFKAALFAAGMLFVLPAVIDRIGKTRQQRLQRSRSLVESSLGSVMSDLSTAKARIQEIRDGMSKKLTEIE